ncbi:MAG: phosphoglycerate mutase family protein [Aquisalinus sp.]|nr:phosphoglycerate mutase family protein [Aquisalinus sp.]
MTGRIITVRHGKPDISRDVRITAREYGDWWAQYNRSGLEPDETPPESLLEVTSKATYALSSTMPRAIETASKIFGEDLEVPQNALFVEAPLPPPPVPFIKLRPGTWGVVSRTFWCLGWAPGDTEGHLSTWRRVSQIADYLIDLSDKGDVVLCAHGYLNWMIDRHLLKKRDWLRVARDRRNNYWSWRAYELNAPEVAHGSRPAAEAAE